MSQQCFVFSHDNVTTEVPLSQSRQSRQEVRVTTELGQGQEFLCCDMVFLCRDRVSHWVWFLCHDRVGTNERFCVATGNFRLQHSWLSWEDFLSRSSIFMSEESWPR